jgi:hypothetical protein
VLPSTKTPQISCSVFWAVTHLCLPTTGSSWGVEQYSPSAQVIFSPSATSLVCFCPFVLTPTFVNIFCIALLYQVNDWFVICILCCCCYTPCSNNLWFPFRFEGLLFSHSGIWVFAGELLFIGEVNCFVRTLSVPYGHWVDYRHLFTF